MDFEKTEVSADARFDGATFARSVELGPMVVPGRLSLDGAVFEADAGISVSCGEFSGSGTRFARRADLRIRWAEVALDEASFAGPARLAGVEEFPELDDRAARSCRVDRRLDAQPQPRLLSLRQADVADLALSNLDLRACRFVGAHGLEQLYIEADCSFAQPPAGAWHTRRRTLAEEHDWRAPVPQASARDERHRRQWSPPECRPAGWLEWDRTASFEGQRRIAVLDPSRIEPLYRQLRKGLEDRKDEPGAGDFYYGEMEMRRKRSSAGRWERGLLTGYWLISGYALRASRALIALALVIVVSALLFQSVGFAAEPAVRTQVTGVAPDGSLVHEATPARSLTLQEQLVDAALFSAGTATAVIGTHERRRLTRVGELLRIVLRVVGPILVGLALLSVRGRVKR